MPSTVLTISSNTSEKANCSIMNIKQLSPSTISICSSTFGVFYDTRLNLIQRDSVRSMKSLEVVRLTVASRVATTGRVRETTFSRFDCSEQSCRRLKKIQLHRKSLIQKTVKKQSRRQSTTAFRGRQVTEKLLRDFITELHSGQKQFRWMTFSYSHAVHICAYDVTKYA